MRSNPHKPNLGNKNVTKLAKDLNRVKMKKLASQKFAVRVNASSLQMPRTFFAALSNFLQQNCETLGQNEFVIENTFES